MFTRLYVVGSVLALCAVVQAGITVETYLVDPSEVGAPAEHFVYRFRVTVDPGDDWLAAELYLDLCESCLLFQAPCNDHNPPMPFMFGSCPASQYTSFYTSPACWPNTQQSSNCVTITQLTETDIHLHVAWFDLPVNDSNTFTIAQITTMCQCECFYGWIRIWALSNPGSYFEYPIDINNCGGFEDCNENGVDDLADILSGFSVDCNDSGVPDECESGPYDVPPEITQQPQSAEVNIGESVSLYVGASYSFGHGQLTYQWYLDGSPIASATSATYAIDYAAPFEAGDYHVVVEDGCGTNTSDIATLVVHTPPSIVTDPLDDSISVGGAFVATVSAAGSESLSYQWRQNAIPLSDGDYLSGVNTPTLTLDPVLAISDDGAYDVVITNEAGYVISEPALLTVTPGTCPPSDPPLFVKTYVLTGDADNTPWSWRIESSDGGFSDAVELNVPGVPSGGALAVAQQFADSINTYATAYGCDIDQLLAQARAIAGQVVLSIGTGNNSPFELWVGAAGVEPDCLVVPEQLPACGFNPTIGAISSRSSPTHTNTHASEAQADVLAADDQRHPTDRRGTASDSAGHEPIHHANIDIGNATRTIRVVRHDCRTGERTVFENVHPVGGPRGPSGTATPGAVKMLEDKPPPFGRSFSNLMPKFETWYPWRANCKILYKLAGHSLEASGTLIDGKHVITSGLVVCVGGSGDEWATVTDVYPAYDSGEGQWGSANAISLWTFEDWIDDGKTQDMIGVIELDVPIGDLIGALGYGCEQRDEPLEGAGYPSYPDYTGEYLYGWYGYLDRYGRNPRIEQRSYYGMVGSTLFYTDNGGPFPVYYVHYVHDWDDDQAPTQFTGIDSGLFDGIGDIIAADKPADADMIPLNLEVPDTLLPSGESLGSVKVWVFNYSSAPSDDLLPFPVHLYLSTDNIITTADTLLATTECDSEPPDPPTSTHILFYPSPVVPADLPMGIYYVGVLLDVADSNTGNNTTSGRHAVPINVYCGAVSTPENVDATKGVYSDRVEVTWDPVPPNEVLAGEVFYEVWRSADTTPPDNPYETYIVPTIYADPNAVENTTYYYWVSSREFCDHTSDLSDYATGWRTVVSAPVITASKGQYDTKVRIEWEASLPEGTYYYLVYRNLVKNPNTATAVGGWQADLCLEDTVPAPGVRQYYWVKASTTDNGNGIESGYSWSNSGWVALPPPENVTASDGDDVYYPNGVEIRWDEVPGATWFQVYRSAHSDPNIADPNAISPWKNALGWHDRDFVDEYATPGQTYYYFVKACKTDSGYPASDFSDADDGWRMLPPPAGLQATDGTDTEAVGVSWVAPDFGDLAYQVRRGSDNDPEGANRYSPWQTETVWADESAGPNVTYYYWVQAFAIGGGNHFSDFSVSDTGWRAEDCDGDYVPDHEDPDADPPTLNIHPVNQLVCVGEPVTFTAQASSHITLFYQWQKDSSPISGATDSTYTISYVKPGHAGTYNVIASNSCGEVVSNPAVLTVMAAPAIEQAPADLNVTVDDPVALMAIVSGDEPLTYQWRKGALPLSDDWRITGTTTPTLMIDPAELADTGAYDIQVTNPCGSVISLPAMLTVELPVLPPPGPPYAIITFEVTGDANGIPWSWRIESTDGTFQDTPLINVDGVGSGGALAVANAFASSISAYVVSVGGGPANMKTTVVGTIWGTAMLSISTGSLSPITLYVGPEDGPANCEVTATLPACGFNPLIDKVLLPGQDCNLNGLDDIIDVLGGESADENGNNIPDECEAEPDQLHVAGPIPHELPVGGVGTIDATVQANFVGLPGQEVVFIKLSGEFTFTAGTVLPDGIQAIVTTDGNGLAQMTFTADAVGAGLIQVTVTGTSLPGAYSFFEIVDPPPPLPPDGEFRKVEIQGNIIEPGTLELLEDGS